MRIITCLLALAFLPLAAATAGNPPNNADIYQYRIARTTTPISVDGELNEATWQSAQVATDFWKQQPVDDQRASRRTEVRLVHDGQTLYLAATCYDSAGYFINTLKRDNYGKSDEFALLLDPQGQKTNGYGFGVNALGAQTEVLLTNEDADESWDNRWFSAVRRYPDRWTVEMAIPFKTLRFKDGEMRWGINFIRTEPGLNEVNAWARVPRQFEQHDFGYYGSLIWDEAPRRQGGNVSLIPYATTAFRQDSLAFDINDGKTKFDIGGDAKIALSSSLNLDLTTNPDFSQVEVDAQQTNLTRFSIFFPERRQFFIENGDVFNSFGNFFTGDQIFFSRTIGLDPNRRPVPILYGARLTGNLNPRLRIGAFNIHTRTTKAALGQNYSAATFQHRVWKRSAIKGIFLNRQSFDGTDAISGDHGRNAGGEFEYSSDNGKWAGKLGWLHSIKKGFSAKNNHRYGRFAYNGTRFQTFVEVQNMQENFFSDMGFTGRLVQDDENGDPVRVGFTQIGSMTDLITFPQGESPLNYHWSGIENFVWLNTDGSLNEWYTRLRHFFFFKNTAQLRFRLNNNYVDLLYPFAITDVPLPAKSYNMTEFNVEFRSDERRLLAVETFVVYGQFFNGTKLTSRSLVKFRAQPWGNFSAGLEHNAIRLPDPYGDADIVLATGRLELNFTNNLFWTTFLQYNTQADNFNINSRLQWRFAPMSDLFFVYQNNYRIEGLFGPVDRALILKLNYWFSL